MRLAFLFALGAACLALPARPASADPAAGAKVFEAKGCGACHYTEGPAREKSIEDQLAKKGPELWYAGSKFQKPWLEKWLTDPKPIRPMAYNSLTKSNPDDHPRLSAEDALRVTAFLMSLTSADVKAGVITPKKNLKGRLIFIKKTACTACHRHPKRRGKAVQGGLTGPSLVGARKRLNPDWVYAYLSNPVVFKPVKAMPTFAGILSDKEMKNLATHVANFR